MKYDVEVLKKMVSIYTKNIEMFQQLDTDHSEQQIAEAVANRRLVAAMIEAGGLIVVPEGSRNGNVFFDTQLYAANSHSADVGWWG